MSRTKESDLSLKALIIDITDEARLKSKKSRGGSSALYGNSGKAPASNNKKPGGNGDKKSKCPGCKDPNPSHSPEKCFATNEELRKAFEKRTGRTYVPYFRRDNSSNSKTTKKDKDDGEDGSSFAFVTKTNSGFHNPAFLIFQPPTPGIMATSFDQGSL